MSNFGHDTVPGGLRAFYVPKRIRGIFCNRLALYLNLRIDPEGKSLYLASDCHIRQAIALCTEMMRHINERLSGASFLEDRNFIRDED